MLLEKAMQKGIEMFEAELPQSDPKLKEAICQKYGIGAAISLASSTHGEFNVVLPQWSGLQRQQDGQFRLKLHHTETEKAAASIHLAYSLRDKRVITFWQYPQPINVCFIHQFGFWREDLNCDLFFPYKFIFYSLFICPANACCFVITPNH